MRKSNFLIIIFLCSAFYSCKKKAQNSQVFTSSSYPLAVGDWWQYLKSDGGNTSDTITLSIVSESVNGTIKDYKCNITQGGIVIDTGHFTQSDTSLAYSGNPYYSVFGFFNLQIPFKEGQEWPGVYPNDTIKVAGVADSFEAYHITYKPVYALRRVFNDPHYSMVQLIFLTPNIGLTNQSIEIQSDTAVQTSEVLFLLNYKLQ
jgi:hypothetical protein